MKSLEDIMKKSNKKNWRRVEGVIIEVYGEQNSTWAKYLIDTDEGIIEVSLKISQTGYYPNIPGTEVKFGVFGTGMGKSGVIATREMEIDGRVETVDTYSGVIDPVLIEQKEALFEKGLKPYNLPTDVLQRL